ncbi:MAG: AAA family ATPase, partial [Propionibacterium sp.]|nr:AAA family ATPase [Propionibacterium sp.]
MTISRDALEREIAVEQAHVDKVYANLDVAAASAKELARQGREIFVSDRTDFHREEDGTALFERDAFAYQAARRLAILDAEHEGLVFGRLDLTDEEVRYIGRLGVRDDDYEPLVIDWRAPAAEPFYRATQVAPMDVVRRRVLRCREDKVVGLEDDLLDSSVESDLPIFGEGALMASVTRARGLQMRDIVATIQAEQAEAIRAPYRGVTVIAGGPGTGKTVVALHRAAYLLYTNRARLERGGVLVVGPSSVFMNYIERVLPSLGEDSVTLKSIGAVATDTLGMRSERVDEAAAATAKGSWKMLKVLRRLVRLPFLEEEPRVRVTVQGEVLTLRGKELDRIRDQVLASLRLNRGRSQAESLVVEALQAKLPDDVDVEDIDVPEAIRDHPGMQMFMNSWWPSLGATRVLARLSDPGVLAKVAPELSAAERAAVVRSYAWLDGIDTAQEVPRDWSVADIALLDELVHMLGPEPEEAAPESLVYIDGADDFELVGLGDRFARERVEDPDDDPQSTYAHVLIDEAQDVTPMQWRMLRRRGPQASWTVVGDPAQSSYPDHAETEKAMAEIIGRGQHRTFTLSTNYRSP